MFGWKSEFARVCEYCEIDSKDFQNPSWENVTHEEAVIPKIKGCAIS